MQSALPMAWLASGGILPVEVGGWTLSGSIEQLIALLILPHYEDMRWAVQRCRMSREHGSGCQETLDTPG